MFFKVNKAIDIVKKGDCYYLKRWGKYYAPVSVWKWDGDVMVAERFYSLGEAQEKAKTILFWEKEKEQRTEKSNQEKVEFIKTINQ